MERKGKIVSISISDARDRVGATTGAADPRESRTCSRSHRREEGRERKKQLVDSFVRRGTGSARSSERRQKSAAAKRDRTP